MLTALQATSVVPLRNSLARCVVLPLLDAAFGPTLDAAVNVDSISLRLNPANVAERIFWYRPAAQLKHIRNSPLGKFLGETLRPSDIFVDVGAHLGLYSLVARQCGAKTVLVEPDPLCAAFLRRNAGALGPVHQMGASDSSGTAPFFVGDDAHRDAGSLVRHSGSSRTPYAGTVDVAVGRLDCLLKSVLPLDGQRAVKVIKIDVEGHEEHAVAGLADFLAAGNRPFIWCEVRGDLSPRNPMSALHVSSLLGELGYVPHDVVTKRQVIDVAGTALGRRVFDLLFVPIEG